MRAAPHATKPRSRPIGPGQTWSNLVNRFERPQTHTPAPSPCPQIYLIAIELVVGLVQLAGLFGILGNAHGEIGG